jgi:threonine dehydrogenase-like Zn-dependent dehydrogenase
VRSDLWPYRGLQPIDGPTETPRRCRYLPQLLDLVLNGRIDPGQVFDLTLPLDPVPEGYRTMDERRAIKALLRP